MPLGNFEPGLYHVDQHKMSGIPATGELTNQTVTFRRTTRAITVWSLVAGATIKFGDTSQDAITLPQNKPIRFEVMANQLMATTAAKKVYFVAELMGVRGDSCPDWDNTNDVFFKIA